MRLSSITKAEEETTQTDPGATSPLETREKKPCLLFIEHQRVEEASLDGIRNYEWVL